MDNCDIKCCNLFLFMQNIKAFKLILLFPLDWRIFIFLANIFLFARKRLTSKSISNLQYSWQIKITVVVIVIAISNLSFTFCNYFWWCLHRRQEVVFAIIVVNIFVFIFVNLSFPTFWVVSPPHHSLWLQSARGSPPLTWGAPRFPGGNELALMCYMWLQSGTMVCFSLLGQFQEQYHGLGKYTWCGNAFFCSK